jgi:hypothetical protein
VDKQPIHHHSHLAALRFSIPDGGSHGAIDDQFDRE